ncbi:MAG: DUF2339 domain-containing protein [Calditrichaeota bacterium]|nr:DUF2339 domain-containing protein [Calditrichota bacterium]RQV93047.1 MAG: DUF2339 domain-containing protein [bacterium]RQW03938.1 MAG: DUF2339 domain-containing protein [Calditrichota bacterium]
MASEGIKKEIMRLRNTVSKLEERISRIEARLKSQPVTYHEEEKTSSLLPRNLGEAADSLELRIGRFWFAKAGIVVLAIGIVFLLTFPYSEWPAALPSLIGYLVVGGLQFLSYILRKNYDFLSRYILGGSLLLFYFSTLRLHFYSNNPAVENPLVLVFLLTICVIINLIISVYRESPYLAGLSLLLGYVTAVISDYGFSIFFMLILLVVLSVFLRQRYQWNGLYIFSIIATYVVHMDWFLNNPLLGNKPQFLSEPKTNIIFILVYFIIFAIGNLLWIRQKSENNIVTFGTFINCFTGYGLFILITISKVSEFLFVSHLSASVIFLLLSVLFWVKVKSKYSTFFYSIMAYSALSVAIIVQFKLENSFILLCWQSLLVITTALWYRSKIIVLANFFIFSLIFLFYLVTGRNIGIESLSFGIVALLSARIMNWQKHRLELKTEFMRNAYLGVAFISIPYALYHSVPPAYVAISWVAAALFYFGMSVFLDNKKYRWLALLTLILTIIYVLIIGIIQLEPAFRILSFILLGLVLITLSFIYTKYFGQKSRERDQVSGNRNQDQHNL